MAKKKVAKKKSVKKTVKKKAKPATTKRAKKTAKKTPAKKKAVKKKVSKKTATKKKAVAKKKAKGKPSLGRPKVTGEEKLFLLFRENYHARQIFDFLRVTTVKELEQFSPEEIFKLLTKPVRQTVDSIRRGLAEKNRCLKDDQDFAEKFKDSQ